MRIASCGHSQVKACYTLSIEDTTPLDISILTFTLAPFKRAAPESQLDAPEE
jgi:hypothetical protein